MKHTKRIILLLMIAISATGITGKEFTQSTYGANLFKLMVINNDNAALDLYKKLADLQKKYEELNKQKDIKLYDYMKVRKKQIKDLEEQLEQKELTFKKEQQDKSDKLWGIKKHANDLLLKPKDFFGEQERPDLVAIERKIRFCITP